MKTNTYNTGDYVVDSFDNIMILGEEVILSSGDDGFETDFRLGGINQRISVDSIVRKCAEEEIIKYKEKYENVKM